MEIHKLNAPPVPEPAFAVILTATETAALGVLLATQEAEWSEVGQTEALKAFDHSKIRSLLTAVWNLGIEWEETHRKMLVEHCNHQFEARKREVHRHMSLRAKTPSTDTTKEGS